MDRPTQIADEIRQITEQYKKEVSTNRRTWPLSIKERVSEIKKLGFSCAKISEMTGIPEPTVWTWVGRKTSVKKKAEPQFLPIEVTSTAKNLTAKDLTVKSHSMTMEAPMSLFQIELPGGIRVQNIDLESLIQLSKRLVQ